MKVITLNPQDFDTHAQRLANAVAENVARRFDAIVGIRRGGSYVCDAFLRHYPRERYGMRYDLTLQRPSTKRKEGMVGKMLGYIPRPLLDAMRMAESVILSWRRKIKRDAPVQDVEIPDGLAETLTENTNPEILVIDDAIDSGDTLLSVVETLKKANPGIRVTTAVMTETTRHPRFRATYTLYRNRTLIRFPWSNDYKKN